MLRLAPLFAMIVVGTAGAVMFLYYLFIDWAELEIAYANFSTLSESSADLATLFAAEAYQNIHRTNFFAEGVWALQSTIVAAIGLHGICTCRR